MVKIIVSNKKAYYNYEILEKLEAGIELKGFETKSIREGKVSLKDSFARVDRGEVFLYNMYIGSCAGNISSEDTERTRRLLLHKQEIKRLIRRTEEKGLTLIPLSLYFKRGRVKAELAVAKGKQEFEKREKIKQREVEREIRRKFK